MTTTTKIVRADHKRMFYNAWSVRRMQAGAKNQTRRIVKSKPNPYPFVQEYEHTISAGLVDGEGDESRYEVGTAYYRHEFLNTGDVDYELIGKPKYKPGNTYLVAEPLHKTLYRGDDVVGYQVDDEVAPGFDHTHGYQSRAWEYEPDKLPSIFCPKWACRYAVRIEAVRVERVQDASIEDMEKEGLQVSGWYKSPTAYAEKMSEQWRKKWIEVNSEESWERNDFVWVYELSSLIEID